MLQEKILLYRFILEDKLAKGVSLTRRSTCFVALACFITALTQAQDLNADTPEPSRAIDSNGDVSLAFFHSMYETRFNRLDTDGDGSVSKSEYLFLSRFPQSGTLESSDVDKDVEEEPNVDDLPPEISTQLETAKIEFEIFDQNKDDLVSKSEMMAPIEQASLFDANKDGKLDQREMEAIFRLRPDQSAALQRKK